MWGSSEIRTASVTHDDKGVTEVTAGMRELKVCVCVCVRRQLSKCSKLKASELLSKPAF